MIPEQKKKELKDLLGKLESIKVEPAIVNTEDIKHIQEILSTTREYTKAGDLVGLKKFLTHTRNELRSTNR